MYASSAVTFCACLVLFECSHTVNDWQYRMETKDWAPQLKKNLRIVCLICSHDSGTECQRSSSAGALVRRATGPASRQPTHAAAAAAPTASASSRGSTTTQPPSARFPSVCRTCAPSRSPPRRLLLSLRNEPSSCVRCPSNVAVNRRKRLVLPYTARRRNQALQACAR